MSERDNTQAVIDVATEAAGPQPLDRDGQLCSVVTPAGGTLHVVDIEERLGRYRDTPRRKQGVVTLNTAASLVQYVATHRLDGTVLYADWQQARVIAVLNDHDPGAPGWGDHRAVLALRKTPEWKSWLAHNGQLGSQVAFAEHIEDMAPTIVDPPAADMLELAQTFHASSSVDFTQQNRLTDGQVQLSYRETVAAKAGQSGQLTIPPTFLLRLAVFEGSEPVEVGVRLRYRLREGNLTIGYAIDGPELVEREAVERVVAEIEEGTELTALRGTPRS